MNAERIPTKVRPKGGWNVSTISHILVSFAVVVRFQMNRPMYFSSLMADEDPIKLKEVQLRLGVPRHVLIHLCEKGVIEPDFAETSGRAKHREFSRRNLLEFGVALAVRRLELPVATAAMLVRLLRSFARAVANASRIRIASALLAHGTELALHLYDGHRLVLEARGGTVRRHHSWAQTSMMH